MRWLSRRTVKGASVLLAVPAVEDIGSRKPQACGDSRRLREKVLREMYDQYQANRISKAAGRTDDGAGCCKRFDKEEGCRF